MEINNNKPTVCEVIACPGGIHYGMDLSQGALIKSWKGCFTPITTIATHRENEQIARTLGGVIDFWFQAGI